MTGFPNPLPMLAPRTPQQKCVHSMLRSSKTTFTHIPKPHHRTSLAHLLKAFPHQRRKHCTQNYPAKDQMLFNIHNSK
jgi:hypothetical protein